MYIDCKLEWHKHVKFIQNTAGLYAINEVKHLLSNRQLLTLCSVGRTHHYDNLRGVIYDVA